MNYGDNLAYAKGRLHETYILYKGAVAFVRNVYTDQGVALDVEEPDDEDDEIEVKVGNQIYLELAILERKEKVQKRVRVEEVDLTPLPTGYAFYNGAWRFYCRAPVRAWKQGLCQQNCMALRNGEPGVSYGVPNLQGCQQILSRSYMSVDNAVREGGAFSRNFCVENDKLYYKAMEVGLVQGMQIVLHPRFAYLQRRLEKTQ